MGIFDYFKKKKRHDGVLSCTQEEDLVQKETKCMNTIEEIRQKTDEIRQRTIEIYNSNYREYIPLDIVAFSFAVSGAMGEGGGIYVITEDGNVYHANIVYGDMSIDNVFLICPPLRDCQFSWFGADKIPDGWSYHDMGAGNHLFVKGNISKIVKEMSVGLEPSELYQQWKVIVIQAIDLRDR